MATPAAAGQVGIGGDVTLASRYVWRGITRVSAPVAQVAGYLSLDVNSTLFSLGAWVNVETRRARENEATLVGPGRRGIGERSVWAALSRRTSWSDWTLGLSHYDFTGAHAPAGDTSAWATTELWATISATTRLPVHPRAAAWLDIDEVRGRYYELGIDYPFPLNPIGHPVSAIVLSAEAGFSDGQARTTPALAASGYFADDGLTHGELSASLVADLAPLVSGSLQIAAHYLIGHDALTRSSNAGRSRGWWTELAVSIASGAARAQAGKR